MSATLNMGVSWSGFNWAPQQQIGDGGGGGGNDWGTPNRGKNAIRPSDKKVIDCLESTFGVLVSRTANTSWSWGYSKNGAHGGFSILALNPQDATVAQFSATTNFRRDSRSLARQYNNEVGGRYSMQSGYTSSTNREVNWIASDVIAGARNGTYKEIGVEALFFHEMGNMFANLLGQKIDSGDSNDPTGDPDKGQQFENCLYGGRVGLRTGRLGVNREL